MRRAWERAWPVLTLTLLVAVFFWRLVILGQVMVPADLLQNFPPWRFTTHAGSGVHNWYASDVIDSQYPARAVARDILRSGHLPLWDPYTSSGRPLGTMPVYGLSFPFNVLLVLLPLDIGFSWLVVIRLLIGAVSMFAFLRELGLAKLAGVVGGVIFAFNGFIIVWLNASAGVTLAVAPLLFWTGERLIHRSKMGNALLLALSVATVISGGFLQVVLYLLYALVSYLVFRVSLQTWRSRRWRAAVRKLGLAGLAVALGIALMAPQLWSFWDHMRLTSYDESRTGAGLISEQLHHVIRYVLPNYYGKPYIGDCYGTYPEHTGYVGIAPLFLSAVTLAVAGRRRKTAWFFSILAVVAVGTVYGAPFIHWVVQLPGLNVSVSLRMKSLVALSLAVTAAFGLDFLQQPRELESARWRVVAAVLVMASLQAVMIVGTEHYWQAIEGAGGFKNTLSSLLKRGELEHYLVRGFLLYMLWALGSLTLLTARVKGFVTKHAVGWGMLLLICLDLVGWAMPYNQPIDRSQVFPPTRGIEFLQDDSGVFRMTGLDKVLWSNTAAVYHLKDIAGHDPLASDRYRRFLKHIDPDARFLVRGTVLRLSSKTADVSSPLLDLLNVKYIADSPLRPAGRLSDGDGSLFPVYIGKDMTIYENTEVIPRAYMVSQVQVVSDPEAVLTRLVEGSTEPTRVALLEEELEEPLSETARVLSAPEIVSYSANRAQIQLEVEGTALLVFGDMYYPGWAARLDDKPTKIYRANYLFRGVVIPPGSHMVEFIFRPCPYYLGQVIRLAAVLGMVIAVGWEKLREWKRAGEKAR